MASDPKTLKLRAEKAFKKEQQTREGSKAAEQYAAHGEAVRTNMERLREERRVREAEQSAGDDAKDKT